MVRVADYWDKQAFIFVLDATAAPRFPEAKEELRLLDERDETASLPLLVLANKMDMADAADVDTISAALDIDALARGRFRRPAVMKVLCTISCKLSLFDSQRLAGCICHDRRGDRRGFGMGEGDLGPLGGLLRIFSIGRGQLVLTECTAQLNEQAGS
jgi:hypothetical protein